MMSSHVTPIATALVLTGAALLFVSPTAVAASPAQTRPQAQIPTLRLPDLSGSPRDLRQWRGKPVLLNYWATWCGPCLKELPELEAFAKAQASKPNGIQLVGIAQDEAGPASALTKRLGLSYPQLVEVDGPPGSAAALGNPGGTLPFSVLLDAQGRILKIHNGPLDAAELSRWAKLAEASP